MAERIDSVLSRQLQSQLISKLKGPEVKELVDELTRSLAEDISRQVRELAIVPTSPLQKLKKRLEFQNSNPRKWVETGKFSKSISLGTYYKSYY